MSIFPMVAVGMTILGTFADSWPAVLRALVLTLVVVPLAVYVIVPALLRMELHLRGRILRSRRRRTAGASLARHTP